MILVSLRLKKNFRRFYLDDGYEGKVFVGRAVLTHEYAEQIGADFYAKESVEITKKILG